MGCGTSTILMYMTTRSLIPYVCWRGGEREGRESVREGQDTSDAFCFPLQHMETLMGKDRVDWEYFKCLTLLIIFPALRTIGLTALSSPAPLLSSRLFNCSNRFQGDTYYLDSLSATRFVWAGRQNTFSKFQSYGEETTGQAYVYQGKLSLTSLPSLSLYSFHTFLLINVYLASLV